MSNNIVTKLVTVLRDISEFLLIFILVVSVEVGMLPFWQVYVSNLYDKRCVPFSITIVQKKKKIYSHRWVNLLHFWTRKLKSSIF